MATTRAYYSTDSGAPTLTGQVGSLLTLLDTCLVGTAGVAYGSKAAAGWTKPYTGTNKAAFQNSVAEGGTGVYVRVDDSAAQTALIRAYATMSDVDTGTSPCPLTTGTYASGGLLPKSNTVDSTQRAWALFADELTWYLWWHRGGNRMWQFAGGGDFDSFIPSDPNRYFLIFIKSGWNSNGGSCYAATMSSAYSGFADQGLLIADSYAPSGTPQDFSPLYLKTSDNEIGGSSVVMTSASPGSGLNMYMPYFIGAENIIRGKLRGLRCPLNNMLPIVAPDATGALVVDAGVTGEPLGSSFMLMPINSGTGNNTGVTGCLAVETVVDW